MLQKLCLYERLCEDKSIEKKRGSLTIHVTRRVSRKMIVTCIKSL